MRPVQWRPRGFAPRLALIVALGLAVRVVYALTVMRHVHVTGDGNEFHGLARILADHGRYSEPVPGPVIPTAEKPPLWPLVLALPAKAGLGTITAQRLVASVVGAGTVAVIGLVGRRVSGERTGLVAAAIAAVYPVLVGLDSTLRSETLYGLLIALALLAAYRAVDRPGAGRAALLGAVIALAALTRGEGIALAVLLVGAVVRLVPRGARLRTAVAALAACALIVTPWLARNWITFDRPTGISTNEGGLLAGANCDRSYYSDVIGWWACLPHHDPAWGTNEAVISSHLRGRAFEYASDHSGRVPVVVLARLGRTFALYRPRQQSDLEAFFTDRRGRELEIGTAVYYLLALLAIAGAVRLRRERQPVSILLAPIVLVALASMASYGSFRFRVAADLPIVALAACALAGRTRLS
jgi:4-amino-4-deoxy-L-arabinose transferase-like glycosyltransferase